MLPSEQLVTMTLIRDQKMHNLVWLFVPEKCSMNGWASILMKVGTLPVPSIWPCGGTTGGQIQGSVLALGLQRQFITFNVQFDWRAGRNRHHGIHWRDRHWLQTATAQHRRRQHWIGGEYTVGGHVMRGHTLGKNWAAGGNAKQLLIDTWWRGSVGWNGRRLVVRWWPPLIGRFWFWSLTVIFTIKVMSMSADMFA